MSDANRPLKDYSQVKDPYYGDVTTKMRILVDADQSPPNPRPQNLFGSAPLRSPGAFHQHDKDARKNQVSSVGGEVRHSQSLEAKQLQEKFGAFQASLHLFEEKKTMLFDLVTYEGLLSKEEAAGFELRGKSIDERYRALEETEIKSPEDMTRHEGELKKLEEELTILNHEIKTSIKKALKEKEEKGVTSGNQEVVANETLTLLRQTIPLFEKYAVLKQSAQFAEAGGLTSSLDDLKQKLESSPEKKDVDLFAAQISKLHDLIEEHKKKTTPLERGTGGSPWPEDIFVTDNIDGVEKLYILQHGRRIEVDPTFWLSERKSFEEVYEKYKAVLAEVPKEVSANLTEMNDQIIAAIRNNDLAIAASLREELNKKIDTLTQARVGNDTPRSQAEEKGSLEALKKKHEELYRHNRATYTETYAHKTWNDNDPEKQASKEVMQSLYESLSKERIELEEYIVSLENRAKLGAAQQGEDIKTEVEELKNRIQILDDEIRDVSQFSFIQKIEHLRQNAKEKDLKKNTQTTVTPIILAKTASPTPPFTVAEGGASVAEQEVNNEPEVVSNKKGEENDSTEVDIHLDGAREQVNNIAPLPPVEQDQPTPQRQESEEEVSIESKEIVTDENAEHVDIEITPVTAEVDSEQEPALPQTQEDKVERQTAIKNFIETLNKKVAEKWGTSWKGYVVGALGGVALGVAIPAFWPKGEPQVKKPTTLEQAVSWRDGVGKDDLIFVEDLSSKKLGFDGFIRTYAPLCRIDPNNPETIHRISRLDVKDLMEAEGSYAGLEPQTREQLCKLVAKAYTLNGASRDRDGKMYTEFTNKRDLPHMPLEEYLALTLKTVTEADALEAKRKKMI